MHLHLGCWPVGAREAECVLLCPYACACVTAQSMVACDECMAACEVYSHQHGRPQKGVISVRFSCKFSKSANPMQIGRFFGGGNDSGQVLTPSFPSYFGPVLLSLLCRSTHSCPPLSSVLL